MVMQPTHFWNLPDRAYLRPLDRPRYRTIHVQCPMRTPVMIILEITSQKPPQMWLVQDDHVVEAFATDTPDEPFDVGILPGTSGRDQHLFDPHVPYSLPKVRPVDTITVAQEMPRCLVPREGFDHLLCSPFRGGVLRDVQMNDAAPFMGQDETHEEHSGVTVQLVLKPPVWSRNKISILVLQRGFTPVW